jgi:hypothetical protein
LRHYHREWDEETRMYGTEPLHDWASHYADGWRTASVSWRKASPTHADSPLVDRLLAADPTKQPFKAYVDAHLKKHRLARLERQA